MITDLSTNRIYALSQWQTFIRVFTYKMAAKINWIWNKITSLSPYVLSENKRLTIDYKVV